ncbi:MAG: filamin/ABP280 repeat domain-containing protein [Gemmatimonadota bacterium]|jgi:hypothetical protein
MRRFFGLLAGIFLLVSCTESNDPNTVDSPEREVPSISTASEIVDGSSGDPEANPFFFFLPTIAESGLGDTGAPAVGLSPVVTVCPMQVWDGVAESCPSPFAVFSKEPDPFGTVVSEKDGKGEYGVPLKHRDYPFEAGDEFRVAVGIAGKVLGWADLRAYDVSGPMPRLDEDGYVILDTGTENFNISFRIAEGALEAEYCDLTSVEDCDVEIFAYEETGCLRVFENPGETGETLGSQACVPANAAELNGKRVEGEYAVILTLEEDDQFQGGDVPGPSQVRFFSDLETDPPGIEFNPGSEGMGVVICQERYDPDMANGIPDDLHHQLRPFIVYSNGETVLPGRDEYSFGAPECEGFGSHLHSTAAADAEASEKGFLDRLAAGISTASSFLLPRPLHARRLHGGLNTTVYDTRSSKDGGGDASPGQATMVIEQAEESFVVELGALLDLDPSSSVASVPAYGKVGEETTVTVNVLNAQSLPFPFEVPVELMAANGSEIIEASGEFQGGGVYEIRFTPTAAGTYEVTITIDGFEIADSPFTFEALPVVGDLTVVVDISGGAPADGLPVYLYEGTDAGSLVSGVTDATGAAFFPAIEVGKSYTIHLPKRDFDVTFTTMTQVIDFQEEERTVTFYGDTQDLGPGVRVFRVKETNGTGNAYQYMVGGRSWNSAQNQVQSDYLLGIQGHLVDILGQEENDFVKNFFSTDPSLCPDETNEKKCKYKGWIGLTDDAVEGQFEWTTGAPTVFFKWPDGQTAADQPEDRKGNLDHVEIGLSGIWGIINGASSTNEGYFVEWDVEWPDTPPFSG